MRDEQEGETMSGTHGTVVILCGLMLVAMMGSLSPTVTLAEETHGQPTESHAMRTETERNSPAGGISSGGETPPDSLTVATSIVVAGVSMASLLSVAMTMRSLAEVDDEESGAESSGTEHTEQRRCRDDDTREEASEASVCPTAMGIDDPDGTELLDDGHACESGNPNSHA